MQWIRTKKWVKILRIPLFVSGGENENSTLYKRFKFDDAAGKIRAKTGSRAGVSALAGYLTTAQNKKLIFVIMIDHFLESAGKIKQFEDGFCRLLIGSRESKGQGE